MVWRKNKAVEMKEYGIVYMKQNKEEIKCVMNKKSLEGTYTKLVMVVISKLGRGDWS